MRRRLRLKTALGASISSARGIEPRRSSPSRRRFAASSGSVRARSTKALRDTKGRENAAWRDAPHKWRRAAREKAQLKDASFRVGSCRGAIRVRRRRTRPEGGDARRTGGGGRNGWESQSGWSGKCVRPPSRSSAARFRRRSRPCGVGFRGRPKAKTASGKKSPPFSEGLKNIFEAMFSGVS